MLPPHESREVKGAHYTRVRPTVSAPQPKLVAYSASVAESLGLTSEMCESALFLRVFSGSPPDDLDTWATVYGASFFGRFGGQRGDGRAISIGQVRGKEIQLKGAGVTPYSRRSDGRAVLRSSVREFLGQESMAALGIPTTRSLCLLTTGETVRRYWYTEAGEQSVRREPGAVGTRVATSFLRFGQMELFAQRQELDLLEELAAHALEREFAHLKPGGPPDGSPEEPPDAPETPALTCRTLLGMFDEVCARQALLLAGWLRVGYCQGNMNSDNAALGGVTLDYGPFAFMEKYSTFYNPWVGGGKEYSFAMQPTAASKNLAGLANAFAALALRLRGAEQRRGGASMPSEADIVKALQASISGRFGDAFRATHADNCRAKLGLATWDEEAAELMDELLRLMDSRAGHRAPPAAATSEGDGPGWRMPWASRDPIDPPSAPLAEHPHEQPSRPAGGVDFSLLFRTLGRPDLPALAAADEADLAFAAALAEDSEGARLPASLRALLLPAALDSVEGWPSAHVREWTAWSRRYWRRVRSEDRGDARLQEMAAANPKYILRNWMAAGAYEAAERGDFATVRELHEVLGAPYAEQSEDVAARWAQVTPQWARERAGLSFMT